MSRSASAMPLGVSGLKSRNTSTKAIWAAALALALACGLAWGEVIGTATAPLDARQARESECSLGDLVADAVRSAMEAELALVQASQLRQEVVPAGELTCEALTNALLYPDEQIVLVQVPGDKIMAALERSLSMLPKPSTAFLQVSGITVAFRSQGSPGERVSEVKIRGDELSPTKTYQVAMPSSLAKGALGYFRIFNGLQAKRTGPPLGQVVCDYVRAARVISPSTERRLRDLTPPAA